MINQEEYERIKLLPDYDWNWIAREKTGKILSFTNKPTKTDEEWEDKQTRLWFNYKDSQLFQFIQWEDEEPYRISDLIKEYEIKGLRLAPSGTVIVDALSGSEETEVKKDKEWAKCIVRKELKTWQNIEGGIDEDGIKYILDIIDQLDEPEKVVVPEDVYEHIKMNKAGGAPLDIALDGAIGKLDILWGDGIQFHEFRNNQDNYAKAWLAYPDIEIEEEPLFYVELIAGVYLEYYPSSGNFGITGHKEDNHGLVKLTEDRIKSLPKGDVLFEHFAVKVEELEE